MMSVFGPYDPLPNYCDIDNGVMILVASAIMTGLTCITLIARIYTRSCMTHSTGRDDYTMWVAAVRMGDVELVFNG